MNPCFNSYMMDNHQVISEEAKIMVNELKRQNGVISITKFANECILQIVHSEWIFYLLLVNWDIKKYLDQIFQTWEWHYLYFTSFCQQIRSRRLFPTLTTFPTWKKTLNSRASWEAHKLGINSYFFLFGWFNLAFLLLSVDNYNICDTILNMHYPLWKQVKQNDYSFLNNLFKDFS